MYKQSGIVLRRRVVPVGVEDPRWESNLGGGSGQGLLNRFVDDCCGPGAIIPGVQEANGDTMDATNNSAVKGSVFDTCV